MHEHICIYKRGQMIKRSKRKNISFGVLCINKGRVAAVKKQMKTDVVMTKVAQTFKVLGDLTRTKIIFALLEEELCVCDIASLLGISQSAISHQLRVLRNMSLVKCRKDGKVAYYTLDDGHINSLFEEGLRHVTQA